MVMEDSQLHTVIDQDGAALLNVESGLISTLNPTGAYVWQALKRCETIETIVAKICRDTGETALTVERDVRKFVETLQENHLLPR